MTLLHHIAFDANLEALDMFKTLPYYKDIVDLDNNEVRGISIHTVPFRLDGLQHYGQLQEVKLRSFNR